MNTPSNSTPEPAAGSQVMAPAPPALRLLYWSVRRELWEYRSIYIAPLAAAGVVLLGFLIATIGRALSTPNLAQRASVLEEPYNFATEVIMFAAFLASLFYSFDTLHSERRDRSILFWKSLPVSDLMTVLAKTCVALVAVPLLSFMIVVVTQLIMLLMSTAVLLASGLSITPLWTRLSEALLLLLYHLVTIHMLWYAPFYAWLLMMSAWARRMPLLWAVIPPLVIGIFEKVAFRTSHFAALLEYRFTGGPEGDVLTKGGLEMDALSHLHPGRFLLSPGLWIGLMVAAAFLAAAVRLRRDQGPI